MKNSNFKIYLVGVPSRLKKITRHKVEEAITNTCRVMNYSKPVTVVVFAVQPDNVISEIGTMGKALGKEGISIYVDYSRKDINEILRQHISAAVYHELGHIIWENNIGFEKNLLDMMVSEGIASSVEKHFQPKQDIYYAAKIKNEKTLITKAKKYFNDENYNYSDWFFGTGKYPKWLGYRIGYIIVQSAKNNTPLPSLIKLSSKEIFDKSGL